MQDAEQIGRRAIVERASIFLSYRRSDSQAWVGRLSDDLRQYFSRERVYRDLDSNRGAQDYVRQINEALGQSRVVIAVIGPSWLESVAAGTRRLDNPEDPVRLELSASLASGIAIVPVLVGGAIMPGSGNLPNGLASLARLHAQRMSDEDWPYDLGRLLETLEKNGLRPSMTQTDPGVGEQLPSATKKRRYERTFQSSRRRAFDALVGSVELLRYPTIEADPQSAQIVFNIPTRVVTAKVLDKDPGYSQIVVEFSSVRSGTLVGGSIAALFVAPPVAALAAAGAVGLRGLERRFAVGFLDNVQRVLEGQGIGEDSAVFPGVEKWRNRSREV